MEAEDAESGDRENQANSSVNTNEIYVDVSFALRHPHVSCHVMQVMKISRSYVQPSTRP